jgi:HTH-type transcriptional regulator/antitoxin HigA
MSTHTLDQAKYGKLLAKSRPHIIRTDEDLEHFTEMLLELDELDNPSEEQNELAELLTTLIEQYEAEHYALPKATPTELISFLLEQRRQSAKDLWPVFGSKGITSEILAGKRPIGIVTASKLGSFFNVPPQLFIGWKANTAHQA